MKILGSTKNFFDQDKHGEHAPKLESVEVVLMHCNLVNNNYQQTSIYLIFSNYYLLLYQINNLGS